MIRVIPKSLRTKIRNKLDAWLVNSDKIRELQNSILDFKIRINQLEESLKIYNDLKIPPPQKLQKRIVGGYFEDFVRSGYRSIEDFNKALSKYGKDISDFQSILDFGCGCGRIFMVLNREYSNLNIFGCDIDPEAIRYCSEQLGDIGEFAVNNDNPPSNFQDDKFDLIYGVSVFTHLPEKLQFDWLKDLKRISKTGGYLLLTVENKKILKYLNPDQRSKFDSYGFIQIQMGKVEGLPDYYKTTLHSHSYIKDKWSEYFDILDIISLGSENHQDLVVCKSY